MCLILSFLKILYSLLYHQFAWSYDLAAWIVSLGQWNEWVNVCLPYLQGRILEIGYGPGHLQVTLAGKRLSAFGLDESRAMARQAARRLRRAGEPVRLVRGLAQAMPFPGEIFDTIVATFPSEYIFDPLSLAEIQRLLVPGGRLVILPFAWITGLRPLERLVAWAMRKTGEAPGKAAYLPASVRKQFTTHGFDLRQEIISLPRSKVLVIQAVKGDANR